jgi:hypothetical protein
MDKRDPVNRLVPVGESSDKIASPWDEHCVHCGKVLPPPMREDADAAGWSMALWPIGEAFAWLIALGVVTGASLWALGSCAAAIVFIIMALVIWRVYFPRRCPWCRQWQSARAVRRWRQGRCVACGYDLTGNVSNQCPECGQPTPSADPGSGGAGCRGPAGRGSCSRGRATAHTKCRGAAGRGRGVPNERAAAPAAARPARR